MGIAAGMKDITQEIASSYDVRVTEVGRLKKEAKEMLATFQASHKKMGTQLKKDLGQDKAEMAAEVRAMRKGFQTSHEAMGSALDEDLAQHSQALRGEVAKVRQETRASHQDMSTKLKKELTRGATARKSEVKGMLNGFRKSRREAGTQLRRELADYDWRINSEVARIRQETRADLREASAAWQELASTMQAEKAGVKMPSEVKPAREIPDLEAKLLATINEHPNGITLTEVAESLGVVPIVLGRASRKLLSEGKIRKEDKVYFPASAE